MTKQELIGHIFDTYSVEPDHPFPGDSDSCVFRHSGSRKWFALVMNVSYRTLGMPGEGCTDILNVKCDPLLASSLRGKRGFRPAWHMNKDRWITILLDGSADRGDIIALLDVSWGLTSGGRVRKDSGNEDLH